MIISDVAQGKSTPPAAEICRYRDVKQPWQRMFLRLEHTESTGGACPVCPYCPAETKFLDIAGITAIISGVKENTLSRVAEGTAL